MNNYIYNKILKYTMKIGNSEIEKLYIGEDEVDKLYLGTDLIYEKGSGPDYRTMPLTFEILSGGTICWKAQNSGYTVTLEYSKNGGEWTSITSNTGTSAPTITVESGDTVQFRGNNATLATNGSYYNTFSGTTCTANLSGNIMSLIKKENFSTADTLQSAYTFYSLFRYCSRLRDASILVLPATTLANNCYGYMFQRCGNLTSAPELPATTLANYCYRNMFEGCSSLTSAPALPATTLTKLCYESMFSGCNNLIKAPELPATTLSDTCYSQMFNGCTSLVNAPSILPATTLATTCYQNMFYGCTSLTTAPELPATTLVNSCYQNMFSGCKNLIKAPKLPATTLASNCYVNMFKGCTSLTTAPELPATTLVNSCYQSMFYNCSSLNYIKCLATDISANRCTNNWVSGVASTGTFVKAAGVNWSTGVNGVPTGWTIQDNV